MSDNKNCRYLVLLETSGNQNYIFATNKLKENIGASELTYRAGTQWVLEIVGDINNTPNLEVWTDGDRLRQNLLNSKLNPHIEESDKPVEIIIATSGKALLLTKDEATAQEIIRRVTLQALQEAPGLDICGVFVDFDWEKEGDLIKAIKQVYQDFQKVHSKIPSPALRFQRIPIIQDCKNSEFPAFCLNKEKEPLSKISMEKQEQKLESLKRLNRILSNNSKQIKFIEDVNKLQKKLQDDLDWLAVIHADGNGLGQIFLNFQECLDEDKKNNSREYVNKLREFSIALDICTEKAFLTAIEQVPTIKDKELPLVPLILGGDDLTVICQGKSALNFTKTFLESFEYETSQTQKVGEDHPLDVIPKIDGKAFNGVDHLSACAGVAIIKPHFPFSVAYELAEDLIKQAKRIKKIITDPEKTDQPYPCSALDFHILYDSSDVDLELIRDKLKIDEQDKEIVLHNRPYVVTGLDKLENAKGEEWAKFHHWDKLMEKVKVIKAKSKDNPDKKKLPSSQTHDLRAALFLGKEVADARYKLIYPRYKDIGIETLAGSKESLFQKEPESEDKTTHTTGLLDAIDVAEFITVEAEKNV